MIHHNFNGVNVIEVSLIIDTAHQVDTAQLRIMAEWLHRGVDHFRMGHRFIALYHNNQFCINPGGSLGNPITGAFMGVSGHYHAGAKILRRLPDFLVASGYVSSIEGITQGNALVNMFQHGPA